MVIGAVSSRPVKSNPSGDARSQSQAARDRRSTHASQPVTIGFLNNMAGAAFQATERQFLSLLNSACEGTPIQVSYYTLPGLSPGDAGGSEFASHYQSVEALLATKLDGLIVTGREPKAADLRDEPYWQSFTQVLDWARQNTYASIWSCLAAHAAVLHMDGIARQRSADKNFGVFECARAADHPLTRGLSERFHVPHSRWNGVEEKNLAAEGYSVLSRITGDGVDTFVKDEQSLLLFLQGHLEYETDTLMREYRRDVGRYIKRESETYPLLPRDYFDRKTENALTELRDRAGSQRRTALLADVAQVIEDAKISNTWHASASRIYTNWLNEICARKSDGGLKSPSNSAFSISR